MTINYTNNFIFTARWTKQYQEWNKGHREDFYLKAKVGRKTALGYMQFGNNAAEHARPDNSVFLTSNTRLRISK
jgi:hypothetical protein